MLEKIYIYIKNHKISQKEEDSFTKMLAENDISCEKIERINEASAVNSLVLTDVVQRELDFLKNKNIYAAGFATPSQYGYRYVCETLDVEVSYFRLVYARLADEPFVVAKTQNLLIREMTTDDLPELYSVYKTLEDCPYIEQLYDYEKELEFTRNYINNMYKFFEYGLWLVFEKNTGRLVGRAGIENRKIDGVNCQEIGYLIRKDCWHKGYAYEACQAVLEYGAKELGLEEIFAAIDKENEPSRRLAQKLGFAFYAQTDDGPDLFKKKL